MDQSKQTHLPILKRAYWLGHKRVSDIMDEKGTLKKQANFDQDLSLLKQADLHLTNTGIAARFTALDDAVSFLKKAGMQKAAAALHKVAMEEAEAMNQTMNDPSEDEIAEAIAMGAAENIAENLERPIDDPLVQQLAAQVVEEIATENTATAE